MSSADGVLNFDSFSGGHKMYRYMDSESMTITIEADTIVTTVEVSDLTLSGVSIANMGAKVNVSLISSGEGWVTVNFIPTIVNSENWYVSLGDNSKIFPLPYKLNETLTVKICDMGGNCQTDTVKVTTQDLLNSNLYSVLTGGIPNPMTLLAHGWTNFLDFFNVMLHGLPIYATILVVVGIVLILFLINTLYLVLDTYFATAIKMLNSSGNWHWSIILYIVYYTLYILTLRWLFRIVWCFILMLKWIVGKAVNVVSKRNKDLEKKQDQERENVTPNVIRAEDLINNPSLRQRPTPRTPVDSELDYDGPIGGRTRNAREGK